MQKKSNKAKESNGSLFTKEYYDPSKPGSFSGKQAFLRELNRRGYTISKEDLDNWLRKQDSYNLHVTPRKKFSRNRIFVPTIDDTWQVDLIDLKKIAKFNNSMNYLLCIIDVFSKFAWVVPLPSKTNNHIIKAFKDVFRSSKRKPKRIHSDQGLEFVGGPTQRFLKEEGVHFYYLSSEMKAAIVERFNRTLKEKMWRYFTHKNSKRYIDVLPQIVDSYNNTYHRSIKLKPISVSKDKEREVFKNLYGEGLSKIDIKFKVDDIVRISIDKNKFEKSYTPNWKKELYKVDEVVIRPDQAVYKIRSLDENEEITGIFYEWQLQKVQ